VGFTVAKSWMLWPTWVAVTVLVGKAPAATGDTESISTETAGCLTVMVQTLRAVSSPVTASLVVAVSVVTPGLAPRTLKLRESEFVIATLVWAGSSSHSSTSVDSTGSTVAWIVATSFGRIAMS